MAIEEELKAIAEDFSGEYALYAEHLRTGEVIQFGDVERPRETASVLKLPVLVAALWQCQQGERTLSDILVYEPSDYVEGSGVLQHLTLGTALPLKDVLTLMIIISDNVATNMVLRTIDRDRVNACMRGLGLRVTQVVRNISFQNEKQGQPLGLSTPKELTQLLKALYRGEILTGAYREVALDILSRQQYQTLLTRYLPYELVSTEEEEPPLVRVLSKSGSLRGIRNDAGLVLTPWGDYAIAVMSERSQDQRFHPDTEAHVVLPRASRAVFQYFCRPFPPQVIPARKDDA
ncbi:MAG: class A beta-lactamase-related serine hydrolase [Firmicutes bacterium]|nr:class A beta-lactamase-related serine hydrolase [Bacillota bacterium]